MSFATFALIAAVAVLGPVLALRRSWHLPVVLEELAGGIALGPTGLGLLRARNDTFTFLADIGFALVMFVAGSHVPVGDRLRATLRTGLLRAVGVGALSAALGVLLANAFGTGHAALYGVLLASSSAATIGSQSGLLRPGETGCAAAWGTSDHRGSRTVHEHGRSSRLGGRRLPQHTANHMQRVRLPAVGC